MLRVNSVELLSEVLARARATVGRSPEQVGEQTGVNGRTIRRLEDGESVNPRSTTLRALADYYGLHASVLTFLASRSELDEGQLRTQVFALAGMDAVETVRRQAESDDEREVLIDVAMRLARSGASRRGPTDGPAASADVNPAERLEFEELVTVLRLLDRRRRRLAADLIAELHRGQVTEQVAARKRVDPASLRRVSLPPEPGKRPQ
jgi:transcriptional regulator with XRE-family HTH domain